MCALFCSLAVNAQESSTNVNNVSKESTKFITVGLGYYGFNGMENYGITIHNSSLKFEIMAKQLYVASQRVL